MALGKSFSLYRHWCPLYTLEKRMSTAYDCPKPRSVKPLPEQLSSKRYVLPGTGFLCHILLDVCLLPVLVKCLLPDRLPKVRGPASQAWTSSRGPRPSGVKFLSPGLVRTIHISGCPKTVYINATCLDSKSCVATALLGQQSLPVSVCLPLMTTSFIPSPFPKQEKTAW